MYLKPNLAFLGNVIVNLGGAKNPNWDIDQLLRLLKNFQKLLKSMALQEA